MARERKIIGIWPAGQTGATTHEADGTAIAPVDHIGELPMDAPELGEAFDPPVGTILPLGGNEPDNHWLTSPDVESKPPSLWWLVLTIAAVLAWGVWTAWSASNGWTMVPPITAIYGHASEFLVPATLIILLWLVGGYVGGRGAARHLRLLAKVRAEQQQLDDRLTSVGQHWLEAHDRLVARSHAMAEEMLTASRTLDSVSNNVDERMRAAVLAAAEVTEQGQAARRHMEGLILALPKVDETARRMADTIKSAGQSAYQYGGQMEERIAQLRAEMAEAESVATSANQSVSGHVDNLQAAVASVDRVAGQAGDRFATTLAHQRDAALSLLVELAASLETHAAQTESRFGALRAALTDTGTEHLDVLDGRISNGVAAAAAFDVQLNTIVTTATTVDTHLATILRQAVERLSAIDEQSVASRASFAALADGIATNADMIEGKIATASQLAMEHVGHAAEMQQTLEAATDVASGRLPAALAGLQEVQSAGQAALDEMSSRLDAQLSAAAEMQRRIDASGASLQQHAELLRAIHDDAADLRAQQQAEIDALAGQVAGLRSGLDGELSQWGAAIEATQAGLTSAADNHSQQLTAAIDQALARASSPDIEARLAAVAQAAVSAVARAEELSVRLAQQVAAIEQSSATLADRIATTQTQVDSQSSDTLARLVARTNEALQSTAVDLTRLLSADVSDQAWEAYLKGDRGVFARRAVRLLNTAEARDVLARYQNDDDFRGLVNRYIHDFEAILRSVMDTRDGAALTVTLLSSDIGKVYVALAQAIERLRN